MSVASPGRLRSQNSLMRSVPRAAPGRCTRGPSDVYDPSLQRAHMRPAGPVSTQTRAPGTGAPSAVVTFPEAAGQDRSHVDLRSRSIAISVSRRLRHMVDHAREATVSGGTVPHVLAARLHYPSRTSFSTHASTEAARREYCRSALSTGPFGRAHAGERRPCHRDRDPVLPPIASRGRLAARDSPGRPCGWLAAGGPCSSLTGRRTRSRTSLGCGARRTCRGQPSRMPHIRRWYRGAPLAFTTPLSSNGARAARRSSVGVEHSAQASADRERDLAAGPRRSRRRDADRVARAEARSPSGPAFPRVYAHTSAPTTERPRVRHNDSESPHRCRWRVRIRSLLACRRRRRREHRKRHTEPSIHASIFSCVLRSLTRAAAKVPRCADLGPVPATPRRLAVQRRAGLLIGLPRSGGGVSR